MDKVLDLQRTNNIDEGNEDCGIRLVHLIMYELVRNINRLENRKYEENSNSSAILHTDSSPTRGREGGKKK